VAGARRKRGARLFARAKRNRRSGGIGGAHRSSGTHNAARLRLKRQRRGIWLRQIRRAASGSAAKASASLAAMRLKRRKKTAAQMALAHRENGSVGEANQRRRNQHGVLATGRLSRQRRAKKPWRGGIRLAAGMAKSSRRSSGASCWRRHGVSSACGAISGSWRAARRARI